MHNEYPDRDPQKQPDLYEYRVTTGPRKGWDGEPDLAKEGWEPDPDRGGESWERFDYHEERYWRRRKREVVVTQRESDGELIAEIVPVQSSCNDCQEEISLKDDGTHCRMCRHKRDEQHASAENREAIQTATLMLDGQPIDIDLLDPYRRERVELCLEFARAVKGNESAARTERLREIEEFVRIVNGGGGGYDSDIKQTLAAHVAWLIAELKADRPSTWQPRNRPWVDYPLGTQARDHTGARWLRVFHGWQAWGGHVSSLPDAAANEVLLPTRDGTDV